MHAFGNETWGPLLIRVLARDRVPLFSLCFLLIAPYFPIGERDTPFVLYLWYVFICVVSGNGLFHSQSVSSSLWGIWLMRIAYGGCISFSNEMLQPLLQCWRFILRLFDLDFHSYQFYCRKNVEQVNKRLRKLCGFRALCNQENKHLFHKSGK